MTAPGFPSVTELESNEAVHRRLLAATINRLNQGKSNCTLDVPITQNAATTTVTDARLSFYCVLCPAMAFTSVGAADIVAGIYITNLINGSATINHRNNAAARTLRFLILG